MLNSRVVVTGVISFLLIFTVLIIKKSYDNVQEVKAQIEADRENVYAKYSIQSIYLDRLDGGNTISNSYGIGRLWMIPAINMDPITLETLITFSVISVDCRINHTFDNYEEMINKYNELSKEYSNM